MVGKVRVGSGDYCNLESKLRKHFKEGVTNWAKCCWEIKKRHNPHWIGIVDAVIQGKVKTRVKTTFLVSLGIKKQMEQ